MFCAGLSAEQLFAIELTGGGTRLTMLQNKIQETFKRDVSKTLNFEESVARGCALMVRGCNPAPCVPLTGPSQCAILSPVFRVREFSVTDLSLYPVKVSWRDRDAKDPMITDKEYDSEHTPPHALTVPL